MAAVLLGALPLGAAPAGAQDVEIVGVVRDSVTGRPVAEARVSWSGHSLAETTDEQGQFRLVVDARDPIVLVVQRLGYEEGRWTVEASAPLRTVELLLRPVQLELEGLTVEAERARFEADIRAPEATTRLTAAEIQRRRGQTLGHTIEEVPGVAIIQYGPSIAKPVVRGLHSQRIVVSNGGVRQEGQQWGGEHAPEIDIFGAQEIQVVRGPGSIVYGSDALGGVVRIEPGSLTGQEGWRGEIVGNAFANNRQGAGSFMLENGAIGLPLVGKTSLRFRASTRKAGDAGSPDVNLRNTGFSELNFSGGLGWMGDWGRSEILLSRYDSELGLFTGAHFGNFDDLMRAMERGPLPSDFSYDIGNPRQEVTHHMALWRSRFVLSDDRMLDVRYAFQLNQRREFDAHGRLSDSSTPAFGLDLYTHTLEGSYSLSSEVGTTQLGLTGLRQGNINRGQGYLIPQYRLYTGGGFVKHDLERGALTVSAAARYDYRWQRVFPVRNRSILEEPRTDVWEDLAGSVGLTWELGQGWLVGGTVGRAWRAPNVNERFSEGVHHGTAQYEIGDPELDAERTVNLDLTLRHAGERFSFQFNAYRNAIDDYIFLRPREPVLTIRGAYPAFNYEQTEAVLRGLELDADVALWRRLHLFGHGSITRGWNEVDDEALFDLPADRLRVGMRWEARGPGLVEGLFAEVSGLLVRDQDQVPPVTIYALPTAGYQLVDLSAGIQELRVGAVPLNVSLEITNLLDRSYRDYLSRYKLFVDDPGRDIVLRIQAPLGG